jgi:hypothetical protein
MAAHWSRFACAALFALSFVAACGDDDDGGDGTTIDAPSGAIDAPDSTGDAGAAPSCADYCTTIAANCTGANLMYASADDCMNTCMKMPPGTVGMTSGNTMGCRLYHAGAAAGGQANADTHCRHAGPGGDGLCGANCEGFCTLVLASCTGANQQYGGSMATCMTQCGAYATTPIYVANATGDTLACRLYHATAASSNPGLHCPHTAMDGGGVCVP